MGNFILFLLRDVRSTFMPCGRNMWLRRCIFIWKRGFQIFSLMAMYKFRSQIGPMETCCMWYAKQSLVQFKGLILLRLNSVSYFYTSCQLVLDAVMDKLQTFWLCISNDHNSSDKYTDYFKHCVTEISSFAEIWDWGEAKVSLMKISCLFLSPYQNPYNAHMHQEVYCSSSLNNETAKEPGRQNFISRFPLLLCSLMVLLLKSWKLTSWREPISPAAKQLFKSAV